MVCISWGQWLIIQGRFVGKVLAPLGAVTVVERRALVLQHPHPDGWRNRP